MAKKTSRTITPVIANETHDRRSLGAEGEARAATYLERRGYRIVGRNVRPGGIEIDLVARRGRLVVFVEVKTRRTRRFGPPEVAVDGRKRMRLVRGASAWLHANPGLAKRVRFDVISWQVDASNRWTIEHHRAAFDADA